MYVKRNVCIIFVYLYFYLKGKNSGCLDIQINTNVLSCCVCFMTLSVVGVHQNWCAGHKNW